MSERYGNVRVNAAQLGFLRDAVRVAAKRQGKAAERFGHVNEGSGLETRMRLAEETAQLLSDASCFITEPIEQQAVEGEMFSETWEAVNEVVFVENESTEVCYVTGHNTRNALLIERAPEMYRLLLGDEDGYTPTHDVRAFLSALGRDIEHAEREEGLRG